MKENGVIDVKMSPGDSIVKKTRSCARAADIMTEHLLVTRNEADAVWRPYINQQGIFYGKKHRHDIFFNAKEFYPESKNGDVVYTSCNVSVEKDHEVWINVIGNVKVFFNGKCLLSSSEKARESVENQKYISLPVYLKKAEKNNLVIKTVCKNDEFGFRLNISPPKCPSLWANFYLVMACVNLPVNGLEKEGGLAVSPLYTGFKDEEEAYNAQCSFEKKQTYKFPKIIAEGNAVDFSAMYDAGKSALAYSCAENDGYFSVRAYSRTTVIVNGKEVCLIAAGSEKRIDTQKDDSIVLKSVNEECGWGFELTGSEGIGLPMLDTDRKDEFKFMYCGPFYKEEAVVFDSDLKKPLVNENGETVFWRFKEAELRAYIDSSFFGQWYYATMLCCYGLLYIGNMQGNDRCREYFLKDMSFLADWYDYARYDFEKYGFAQFMAGAASESLLDHIGTMGVNFIEAYKMTGDEKYMRIIKRLQKNIKDNVSRFEDKTFCRRKSGTMWADDFFMSCPFLIRLYKDLGDKESLDDILIQLNGFKKRLYMPEQKIFSHIYFLETEVKNSIPWGRGNGWIALSMSEVLSLLNDERGEEFETIRSAFAEFCEGLSLLQDDEGMWHQILNNNESYQESSCTAMFTLAMYRGVNSGWIDSKYMDNVKRGIKALLEKNVDKDGVLYGVCMGSSCSMDVTYYLNLGTIKDDNHGTGVVLMLLGDIIKYDGDICVE